MEKMRVSPGQVSVDSGGQESNLRSLEDVGWRFSVPPGEPASHKEELDVPGGI